MKYKNITRFFLFFLVFFIVTQEVYIQECGWSHRVESFIREQDAMEGSWPWMVAIMKLDRFGEYIQSCSGSMITTRHVLSAAHCFDGRNSQYRAMIGNVDERFSQEYDITRIVTHHAYIRRHYYGDIAILTLGKDVDSINFNPICLPPSREFANLTGRYTTVVGWGLTIPSQPIYPKLREKVGLEVISNSKCNEFIHANNFISTFPQGISDEMICTAYSTECIGNSGSPLMYQVEDQWYAVGVKAFGWSCVDSDFPTGYTRVSEYVNWIERNIQLGCGWSNKMNVSLENGEKPEGSWPWMVAIVILNRRGKSDHLCSGSMISNKHVMTAAHCFGHMNPFLYKARIGHADETLVHEYNITRIVIHENYIQGRFYEDIAILTLEREVELENFHPVCLPPSREFINLLGQNTTTVGWERYLSPLQTYPNLREDYGLEVISKSRCNEIFSQMSNFKRQFPRGITDGIVCTAYSGKCLGDPGSPLMYQEEGKWYVVGLASFGRDCNVPDFPVGYTRVSQYLEWIERNIKS